MKKFAFLFAAVAAVFCFTGCVDIETVRTDKLNGQDLASSGRTVAHLNVQNSGLYLFSLPVIAGSVDTIGYPIVCRDTVRADQLAPVMAKEAKKLGGRRLLDVSSQYSEFGFIFYSRTLNMSGNVIK